MSWLLAVGDGEGAGDRIAESPLSIDDDDYYGVPKQIPRVDEML